MPLLNLPVRRYLAPAAVLFVTAVPSVAQQPLEVPLAFAGEAASAAHHGAEQGLAEAQIQGRFLGQSYRLDAAPDEAVAIIAALPADQLETLAAAHPGVPVLNVSLDDDALRDRCRANLFHVLPSARMTADALAQWRQAHPEAGDVAARAWHSSFEKYAGAQLNKRYRKHYDAPMDDRAWAGWAAVKLLSDTVARERTTDPAVLLDALHNRLAFDGQKGIDLSFRSDGQLRQPLLLVGGDRIVGEAPVREVADIEDLDSLGPARCSAP